MQKKIEKYIQFIIFFVENPPKNHQYRDNTAIINLKYSGSYFL